LRAQSIAAIVSEPQKLTRWARPPIAADSGDETPRKPKSSSLKPRSEKSSQPVFS
jgi:hypothetical protein